MAWRGDALSPSCKDDMKILIVEDEAYSRQSLTKQLREMDDRHSFHIMECADGRQGWALFEREKPELVFSDIKMPFMSGLELLKRIMVSRPETKVIIVSGFSDFEFARNALNDGAMGYLLKPVSEADLTQLMNRYFTSSTEQKALAPVSREDALTRHLCRTLIQGRHAPDFTQDGIFLKVFDRYRYLEIMFSGDHYPEPESFTECLSHTLGRIPHTGFRLLQFSRKNWGIVLKANVNFLEVIGNLEQLLDSEGYAYAAGISEEATGCEKLVGMRKQAVIALKSRMFGMHAVCFHAEAVKTHVKSISLPETRYGMFKVCVERGDAANAVMRLEKAANELLDNPRIAVGSIEHFLVRITSILRDAYD